jgi:hypothetical protein
MSRDGQPRTTTCNAIKTATPFVLIANHGALPLWRTAILAVSANLTVNCTAIFPQYY